MKPSAKRARLPGNVISFHTVSLNPDYKRGLRGTFRSQCNAVQKGNPGIITTAGAIKIIIEDPLLSILKENSNET